MNEITWDTIKEQRNIEKHGVAFDEAATVFSDPLSVTFFDTQHSRHEEREITIGLSAKSKLLLVVHVERVKTIRIISARKATRKERKAYEERI